MCQTNAIRGKTGAWSAIDSPPSTSAHATQYPAWSWEVENDSKAYKYVVSNWLVERAGRLRLITMNDLAMGQLFGGYEGFERQLQEQGYQVRALIETFEELVALKHQNPGLAVILWSPNLPKGEDQDSTR
jgi:hypothetical protein